jgi:hypothetical protein
MCTRRDLLLALDCLGGDRKELAKTNEPNALRALGQQLLLEVGRELEAAGDGEREMRCPGIGGLELATGQLHEPAEQRERPLDVGRVGGVVLVGERLHARGDERPARRQLEQAESLPSLDDDVQAAVVEALGYLTDRRERTYLTQPVVIGVHDPERGPTLEAFSDQLLIPRFEDVQRDLLGRQEDEPEREKADLRHLPKTTGEVMDSPARVSKDDGSLPMQLVPAVELVATKGRDGSDRRLRRCGNSVRRSPFRIPAEIRSVISRAHGLALSLLLGAAAAAGAYAVVTTADFGAAQTKPEVISSREIARRARKLDAWEASLRKALEARPPALPALNGYPAVVFVSAPGAIALPSPAPVARSAARPKEAETRPAAKPKATFTAAPAATRRAKPVATPIREEDKPDVPAPVVTPAPVATAPTPSPAPAPVVVAAVPAEPSPPPATSAPPPTLSVEQQCRQLLRAAENRSEQVKQEAERQCEALKQAAERQKRG